MAKYTDADLATIKAAIASGTQLVQYADGRRVQYQDLNQMLAAARVIEAEVNMVAAAGSGVLRRRVPFYKSGLR